MADEIGPVDRPELVVDTDHAELVVGRLRALRVDASRDDGPSLLGLTRIHGLAVENGPEVAPGDIDALLRELRAGIAADYGGWLPIMGKNRVADVLVGPTGSKPMNFANPEPSPDPFSIGPATGESRRPRVGMVDVTVVPHDSFDDHDLTVVGEQPEALDLRSGHGTFVASQILAAAPDVSLVARGIADLTQRRARIWEVATAMVKLVELDGAEIVNGSLGCSTADAQPPLLMQRAVERIRDRALVVAAAGNHGEIDGWDRGRSATSPVWPAALPGVVAVGATTDDGSPVKWSPALPWVTATAPGEGAVGAYLTATIGGTAFEGVAQWSGTSFAAARLSGAVAAQMSAGDDTAHQALERLLAAGSGPIRPYVLPEA